MKVLFVYPCPPERYQEVEFQSGIASISAVLKSAGHRTHLLIVKKIDKKEIDKKISQCVPHLVAITCTSNQMEKIRKIVSIIRESFHLKIVLGGVHPTLMPDESISIEGIFAICRGEGEFALLDLMEALENNEPYRQIQNFWFRGKGEIVKNPIRPLIEDLSVLPFPDRELFDYQKMIDTNHTAQFLAGRGCPYHCTYCINHNLIKLYKGKGKYVRWNRVDRLIREIKDVLARYEGIQQIVFHDDTFTLNRTWLKEFCVRYRKEVPVGFICNIRADDVDEEIVRMLKNAGCLQLRMGLESGNERIRNSILNRKQTTGQIAEAARIIKKHKIHFWTFNMVGLPYETESAILDTIKLNRTIRPDVVFISIFNPYPGKLYDLCVKEGMITGKVNESYFCSNSTLKHTHLKKRDIEFFANIFEICVFYPKAGDLLIDHRIIGYPVGVAYKRFKEMLKACLPNDLKLFVKRLAGLLKSVGD